MRKVGDMWGTGLFKARACDFCTDVLTELADISLGDAWLPDYEPDGMGHSVVLTRSTLAEQIVRDGIAAGELVMDEVSPALAVKSQDGGFNHKRGGVKFRAWMARRFSGLPLPVLRQRLLQDVPVSEGLVQFNRERTRAKSLRFWRDSRDAAVFSRRMRRPLAQLKAAMGSRKDGSTAPLEDLLFGHDTDPVQLADARRLGVGRWLTRAMRSDRLGLGLIRSALRDGAGLRPPAGKTARK